MPLSASSSTAAVASAVKAWSSRCRCRRHATAAVNEQVKRRLRVWTAPFGEKRPWHRAELSTAPAARARRCAGRRCVRAVDAGAYRAGGAAPSPARQTRATVHRPATARFRERQAGITVGQALPLAGIDAGGTRPQKTCSCCSSVRSRVSEHLRRRRDMASVSAALSAKNRSVRPSPAKTLRANSQPAGVPSARRTPYPTWWRSPRWP